MNLAARFDAALSYGDFLARYGTEVHRARWQAVYDEVVLSPAQQELLGRFRRQCRILVLAGAWCGDCARQCPIFQRFSEAAPALVVGFLDRDEHADVQQELQINGGKRIPVAVFFSEDGYEVARFGDRTLSAYRALLAQSQPALAAVVQDWLDQFERVQWLLRLSPRLRRIHGD
jgi:thiol-disulfide isomerase/thioredoxin